MRARRGRGGSNKRFGLFERTYLIDGLIPHYFSNAKQCENSVLVILTYIYFSVTDMNREQNNHCVFFSVRMRENADQNNSEYGHFLHGESLQKK